MSVVQISPLDETGNGGERSAPPARQRSSYQATGQDVKQRLCALYDEVFAHNGYGDIRVEIRALRRGLKEVVLHCGKQYRYVVAYGHGGHGGERRVRVAAMDFRLERRKGGDRRWPGLVLSGFHIHAMSHQLQVERHRQLLDWYLDKWPAWKSLTSNSQAVRYLNVGGGIGVNYLQPEQFGWPALCRHLGQRLKRYPNTPIVRFDPGRFVTAFCGYYVMQVLDIKQNHGQGFAVCRGGTHQFRLPAAQAHDHPVIHVPLRPADGASAKAGTRQTLTVVGQLCTPKDVLARNVVLSDPRIGDLLVLPLAGAYGYNISHADFLCHPRPLQVFLDADQTNASTQWSDGHVANACH